MLLRVSGMLDQSVKSYYDAYDNVNQLVCIFGGVWVFVAEIEFSFRDWRSLDLDIHTYICANTTTYYRYLCLRVEMLLLLCFYLPLLLTP